MQSEQLAKLLVDRDRTLGEVLETVGSRFLIVRLHTQRLELVEKNRLGGGRKHNAGHLQAGQSCPRPKYSTWSDERVSPAIDCRI